VFIPVTPSLVLSDLDRLGYAPAVCVIGVVNTTISYTLLTILRLKLQNYWNHLLELVGSVVVHCGILVLNFGYEGHKGGWFH
jgi:hypothetical protein